ncbi:hypothetical protein [Nocardioides sp. B-3]|uniref:hypothetical protein n=1 Tax=Nocardioides sp. B-3 TaxID=2895565 RepID=UPI002342F379|nr:hypothetical protein [Nocardioides sp. B-3]
MNTPNENTERRGRSRGPGRGHGGPRGRGGWQVADLPSADDAADWFAGRLPSEWFTSVDVTTDREEILVIGTLADESATAAEAEGRISRFRSETREQRIEIALEAEARYQRKVSWGTSLGDTTALFTHVSAPVMTRLRQPERQVLDTRSTRAWPARARTPSPRSVRLVGEHADEWLGQLRDAMSEVDKLRGEGPSL